MLYPLKPLCYPLKSDEVAIITRARNQGTDFDRAHPSRGGQARRKVYIYRYMGVSFHTPHPVLWVSPACKGYGSRQQRPSSTTETGRWISRKKISERGSLRTCPAHQGGVGCHSEKKTLIVTRCCHHRPSPLSNYYMNYGNGSPKQARRGVFRFGLINSPSLTREPLI